METAYFTDSDGANSQYPLRVSNIFSFDPTGRVKDAVPRVIGEIFITVAKQVVFFVNARPNEMGLVANMIKKKFPDVKVLLCGAFPDLESPIRILKTGKIDMLIKAKSIDKVYEYLKRAPEAPLLDDVQCYWREPDGVIQRTKRSTKVPDGSKGKALLVLMPAWNNDYAPFGLAHISAALKEVGHEVKCLDLNWLFWQEAKSSIDNPGTYMDITMWNKRERYANETRPHLNKIFDTLKDEILSGNYAHVGFSLFESNWQASYEAFHMIRKIDSKIKIFCGGPSCTDSQPNFIGMQIERGIIDGAVFGEGEVTAVKLLEKWDKNSPAEVPGAWVRSPKGVLKGPARPLSDINALPLPDFSDFPVYNYDTWMMPLFFSRGCVAKCAFCAETKFWVRFRILKTENLVDRVTWMSEEFGIRRFRFNDSLLNGSHKHLEKFVDSVLDKNLKISFSGYCRLESDLTDQLLQKMSKAGCTMISFGMESASQNVTDLMNKEVDVRNYERIIKDTAAAGIRVTCCVMVGFPGERWRDFFQTAITLFSLRSAIHTLNLNIMAPAAQVARDAQEMTRLNIDETNIAIDGWKTKDGKNTPGIRLFRFWLLANLWKVVRRKEVSPNNWYFTARKSSKRGIFKEEVRMIGPAAV